MPSKTAKTAKTTAKPAEETAAPTKDETPEQTATPETSTETEQVDFAKSLADLKDTFQTQFAEQSKKLDELAKGQEAQAKKIEDLQANQKSGEETAAKIIAETGADPVPGSEGGDEDATSVEDRTAEEHLKAYKAMPVGKEKTAYYRKHIYKANAA